MSDNKIPDIPRPRSGDPETQRFYDAVRQAFSAVQRTDNQSLVTYEELGDAYYRCTTSTRTSAIRLVVGISAMVRQCQQVLRA